MMKKTLTLLLALVLALSSLFSFVACNGDDDGNEEASIWDSATYSENTTLGEGAKVISISIEAEKKTVTLTLKTDAANLGAALYELELVENATFFSTLNGMTADWDKDNAYWAFYMNGEYASVGVGDAAVNGGESFKFVYTVT